MIASLVYVFSLRRRPRKPRRLTNMLPLVYRHPQPIPLLWPNTLKLYPHPPTLSRVRPSSQLRKTRRGVEWVTACKTPKHIYQVYMFSVPSTPTSWFCQSCSFNNPFHTASDAVSYCKLITYRTENELVFPLISTDSPLPSLWAVFRDHYNNIM